MQQFERITADEIQAGDRVARARSHPFFEVSRVEHHEKAVWIYYAGKLHRDRPQRVAKWWRQVDNGDEARAKEVEHAATLSSADRDSMEEDERFLQGVPLDDEPSAAALAARYGEGVS